MAETGEIFMEPTIVFKNNDLRSIAACSDGSIYVQKSNIQVIGSQPTGELGLGTITMVNKLTQITLNGIDLD